MSTPDKTTDTTLVNRAGVNYRTTLDKMSTIQDTDLLIVNRAGVDYRCTAKDIKGALGGGGGLPGLPAADGAIAPSVYDCSLLGVIRFATDDSGVIFGNASPDNSGYNLKTATQIQANQAKAGYRAPFGFVGALPKTQVYSYATRGWVPIADTATANANLVPGAEGLYNVPPAEWFRELRFEVPKYQDGWWIFGLNEYMHYGTGVTPDQVITNTMRARYDTIPALAAAMTATGVTSVSTGDGYARGYESDKGLLWATHKNVVIIHPHDAANAVTVLPLTHPRLNDPKFFIGEWLFVYNGGTQKWTRNTAAGVYTAFTDVTTPAGGNYGDYTTNATMHGAAVCQGKSGDLYAMFKSSAKYAVVHRSKDNGLTWEEYHNLGPMPDSVNSSNLWPSIDPRTNILVSQYRAPNTLTPSNIYLFLPLP